MPLYLETEDFLYGADTVLYDASDVCISESINEEYTLEFQLPYSNTTGLSVGRTVVCEGQIYRVVNINSNDDSKKHSVKCTHVFCFDSKRLHIPNIGSTDDVDFIGVSPYTVVKEAHNKIKKFSSITMFTEQELESRGLHWLGGTDEDNPEFLIDFESVDKTTLWDVLKQIIENAGRGEIYAENKTFALVERIGNDSGAVISTAENMNGVSVEYDISDMITLLYPYGKDGLEITSAAANESGTAYIISPNYIYGTCHGYKDYDLSDPEDLYNRALWEFDEDNPDRIDVPDINISGTVTDIGIPQGIRIGDRVRVLHNGNEINERIISIKRYPFEGTPSSVSIGRVRRDMFFYLNQIGVFTQRYKNISTYNGKIYGDKITGTTKNTYIAQNAITLSNTSAQLTVNGSGIRIIRDENAFFTASKDSFKVADYISVDISGAKFSADSLKLSGYEFTVDEDGNLLFNGRKIQTEEVV